MYIDFGAGEAILSGHEDEVMRDLKKKLLRKEVLAARHGANPISSQLERLRCAMNSWRLALAKRLAASGHPLLDSDEMSFSSGHGCS